MITSETLVDFYLKQVKDLIKKDKYKLEKNTNRKKNIDFYVRFNLTDNAVKKIILSLEAKNFSYITKNKKEGYEHEVLYIFGKDIKMTNIYGEDEVVPLYIKINKIEDSFVVIISFHIQEKPLGFPFK